MKKLFPIIVFGLLAIGCSAQQIAGYISWVQTATPASPTTGAITFTDSSNVWKILYPNGDLMAFGDGSITAPTAKDLTLVSGGTSNNIIASVGTSSGQFQVKNGSTIRFYVDSLGNFNASGGSDSGMAGTGTGFIRWTVNNMSSGTGAYAVMGLANDRNSQSNGNLSIRMTSSGFSGTVVTNGPTGEQGVIFTPGSQPLTLGTAGAAAIKIDTNQNTGIVAKINSYNGIATAGNGIVSVVGSGRSTAQTAAVASVATYTLGAADASFVVDANVLVTASTTNSFTTTCTYTDEGGTSRTQTLTFAQVAGIPLQTITNVTGTGPYAGYPLHIRAKASTTITIGTTGTFTSVTYNVEGSIKQI